MRTLEQWLEYESLELISTTSKHHQIDTGSIMSRLRQIYQWLSSRLTAQTEPRIWKVLDNQGRTYWKVYDPVTQQSAVYVSEADVRIWLEQRYYRS